MRFAAEMQGNVLLGDQTRPYSGAQMLVQETGNFVLANVLPRLQESSCQNRNGIAVSLHQVGHDFGESDFIFNAFYPPLCIRKQGRQGVHIIAVYLRHVGVRDDNIWQSPEALNSMGETGWEDVEGEIGAVEQSFL